MYCTHCGKQLDNQAVICPYCGVATLNMPKLAAAQPVEPKKVNALGIVGFVIGLLSIILGGFYCITPVIGLIFAIIAVAKRKSYNSSNGLAIAGLVLCIVTFLFWLFFWLILPLILETAAALLIILILAMFGGA